MSENNSISHHVELYIRSGRYGDGYGACPFCQRIYMLLMLKADAEALTFDVHLVDQARPLPEFRKIANRLPVLKHDDEVITDNDEAVAYIEEHFPEPVLKVDNAYANAVCLEVFSKFSYYIKQVSHSADQLRQELWRVNDYIEKTGTKFLCGDSLTQLDCLVLPKLQHIRVASYAFKDFAFPVSMNSLWKYMKNAYATEVFRKTCPSDQEIVFHWSSKHETPVLTGEKSKYYCLDREPNYSFDVPDAI